LSATSLTSLRPSDPVIDLRASNPVFYYGVTSHPAPRDSNDRLQALIPVFPTWYRSLRDKASAYA